jgi:hypothetical protein
MKPLSTRPILWPPTSSVPQHLARHPLLRHLGSFQNFPGFVARFPVLQQRIATERTPETLEASPSHFPTSTDADGLESPGEEHGTFDAAPVVSPTPTRRAQSPQIAPHRRETAPAVTNSVASPGVPVQTPTVASSHVSPASHHVSHPESVPPHTAITRESPAETVGPAGEEADVKTAPGAPSVPISFPLPEGGTSGRIGEIEPTNHIDSNPSPTTPARDVELITNNPESLVRSLYAPESPHPLGTEATAPQGASDSRKSEGNRATGPLDSATAAPVGSGQVSRDDEKSGEPSVTTVSPHHKGAEHSDFNPDFNPQAAGAQSVPSTSVQNDAAVGQEVPETVSRVSQDDVGHPSLPVQPPSAPATVSGIRQPAEMRSSLPVSENERAEPSEVPAQDKERDQPKKEVGSEVEPRLETGRTDLTAPPLTSTRTEPNEISKSPFPEAARDSQSNEMPLEVPVRFTESLAPKSSPQALEGQAAPDSLDVQVSPELVSRDVHAESTERLTENKLGTEVETESHLIQSPTPETRAPSALEASGTTDNAQKQPSTEQKHSEDGITRADTLPGKKAISPEEKSDLLSYDAPTGEDRIIRETSAPTTVQHESIATSELATEAPQETGNNVNFPQTEPEGMTSPATGQPGPTSNVSSRPSSPAPVHLESVPEAIAPPVVTPSISAEADSSTAAEANSSTAVPGPPSSSPSATVATSQQRTPPASFSRRSLSSKIQEMPTRMGPPEISEASIESPPPVARSAKPAPVVARESDHLFLPSETTASPTSWFARLTQQASTDPQTTIAPQAPTEPVEVAANPTPAMTSDESFPAENRTHVVSSSFFTQDKHTSVFTEASANEAFLNRTPDPATQNTPTANFTAPGTSPSQVTPQQVTPQTYVTGPSANFPKEVSAPTAAARRIVPPLERQELSSQISNVPMGAARKFQPLVSRSSRRTSPSPHEVSPHESFPGATALDAQRVATPLAGSERSVIQSDAAQSSDAVDLPKQVVATEENGSLKSETVLDSRNIPDTPPASTVSQAEMGAQTRVVRLSPLPDRESTRSARPVLRANPVTSTAIAPTVVRSGPLDVARLALPVSTSVPVATPSLPNQPTDKPAPSREEGAQSRWGVLPSPTQAWPPWVKEMETPGMEIPGMDNTATEVASPPAARPSPFSQSSFPSTIRREEQPDSMSSSPEISGSKPTQHASGVVSDTAPDGTEETQQLSSAELDIVAQQLYGRLKRRLEAERRREGRF